IKMTVWDRGTNKSPGPYGFTFEFYRNYWNILDQDIVVAVSEFFASDDVVFVGKWDISNINTIVHEDVTNAASIIGCATFSSPFNYLGVKLKTLSIGGRITLIKLFLAATPLHHMSLYKAPIGILNRMKFIRRDFFNGIDTSEKKIAWVELEFFLSSKKNGDLAIHGVRGVTDNHSSLKRSFPWTDLDRDFISLNRKEVSLKFLFPRLFALESRKDITVAEKLRQSSYEFSFRHSPRGGLEEEQYNGSGEFSVRSVRCLIDDALLSKSDTPTRWVKLIPMKLNVLAWKICLDRLPTS
ncbi:hypothetical protein Tco_1168231, partial [Tanacetum coccineum]